MTITAIHDGIGVHRGYVKLVRDLTAERAFRDEWAGFLRTFAHDLASPVTALIGYLDLLAETTDLPPELLHRAITAGEHVAEMTQVLAQRLARRDDAEPRPIRLGAIVREAAAIVLPGDVHHRLEFALDADPTVIADPVALRRSVVNIVENAAKYSDGSIRIGVQATEAAVLEVTDHGRGIHPGDLSRIFDVGYRGRFAAGGEGGSGIGLASARELIADQGGAISVDSEVGEGTTVRVELPLARFDTAA